MKHLIITIALGWVGLAWAQGWNIDLLATLPDSGIVSSVSVGEICVFLSTTGLKTVDLTDPLNPGVVGSYRTPGSALAVAVESTFAYVADGDSGLCIINFNNPASPTQIANCSGFAQNVTLASYYAYVVGGAWANLRIINIADPANANQVGSLTIMPGLTNAQDVAISGNYAYIAGGEVGLLVVDITDPANPTQVGVYQGAMSDAMCVAVLGNYAYVSSLNLVTILDITNPQQLIPAGQFTESYGIMDLLIYQNHLYLAESYTGLVIFSLTDPVNPLLVGSYNTAGISLGVACYGTLVLVADWDSLGIYDCSVALPVSPIQKPDLPRAFKLNPNYPNPFNPITTISYDLPHPELVKLTIYNVRGRSVVELINSRQEADSHTVSFDGSALASGVYLCRLKADDYIASQKMTLIK